MTGYRKGDVIEVDFGESRGVGIVQLVDPDEQYDLPLWVMFNEPYPVVEGKERPCSWVSKHRPVKLLQRARGRRGT